MSLNSPEFKERCLYISSIAETIFDIAPDWVTFFREVLSIDGIVRKTFPSIGELAAFEKSEEFEKIQKMLVKLRGKRIVGDSESEPTRVITVRMPKSMHEYLRTEAHDLRTSMNKLCISKLLQVISEEMIPRESSDEPHQHRLTDQVMDIRSRIESYAEQVSEVQADMRSEADHVLDMQRTIQKYANQVSELESVLESDESYVDRQVGRMHPK